MSCEKSMKASAAFTQKCDKCQRFANIPQLPAEPLTAMVSPWPFAQWGLDLIGPMPEGKGQVKYAVVAVDYFTKWAEAEALATITAARIESFVWQSIVCRFGIPNSIVTDNGRQFDNAKFKQFCSNLKIRLCFASPAHPQSNGQLPKPTTQHPSKQLPCPPIAEAVLTTTAERQGLKLASFLQSPLPNGKGLPTQIGCLAPAALPKHLSQLPHLPSLPKSLASDLPSRCQVSCRTARSIGSSYSARHLDSPAEAQLHRPAPPRTPAALLKLSRHEPQPPKP
ncbi:hypothetical protein L3X38_004513 [Prunus dulcis]|uniref:Integrase catalytic domain-containing protein n=1 Tax=Prunus dulcis TaxID=3755 RepID=A0AAD4ZNY9_PRUDU|nr:hypothetical protein L3X38_004513 [Prunus dulcis]